MKCPTCSENLIYEQDNKKMKCDFCGTSIHYEKENDRTVNPQKFLKFDIDLEKAKEKIKEYFVESAYEHKDKIIEELKQIYIPYIMYDCVCESEYVFQTLGRNRRR